MHPFLFATAADARTAAELAARDAGAHFLAGGTTLVDLMRLDVERPSRVIDINALPFASIDALETGVLRIGALVRNADLARDPRVRARYPLLAGAVAAGASGQVRNMATTAGNLLQRTRCYYFRDTGSACNKRESGSGCPAVEGHNRIHAVLGTSPHCIATHASDMAVALVALDAQVRITGLRAERVVPLEQFHLLPGERPDLETVLEHGELVTAVDVPPLPWAVRSLYLKVPGPRFVRVRAGVRRRRARRRRRADSRRASRWAGSRPSPGAQGRPSRRSWGRRRTHSPTGPPPTRPWQARVAVATTPSRSSSQSARSCARSLEPERCREPRRTHQPPRRSREGHGLGALHRGHPARAARVRRDLRQHDRARHDRAHRHGRGRGAARRPRRPDPANAPRLPEDGRAGFGPPADRALSLLQDRRVHYNGQPVAVVVAESLEQAEHAAARVRLAYRTEPPSVDMARALASAYPYTQKILGMIEPTSRRGDLEVGLERADVRVDATYTTPIETHNPMEPHATIASWQNVGLTLYESTQYVYGVRRFVATTLGLPEMAVRVVSEFVGGAFGCKGSAWSHVVLAAIAARRVGRP